jgi:FixJ family two-component response regulator
MIERAGQSGRPCVVYIIDDDDAFRRSLVLLLEEMRWEIEDYGSAGAFTGAHPREPLRKEGCMLLDIRMPGVGGLELQRWMNEQGWSLPVIFITGHGDMELAVQAMKRGAFDFLAKPFRDQALLDAVCGAVRAGRRASRESARKHAAAGQLQKLSPRELQVARLLAKGLPNKGVARILNISDKTVHIHRQHIMEKAEISSAAELARLMLHADPDALDGN